MAKVKIIAKDETGREVPFFTKTLTKEFKDKAGKKYSISIEEPNQPVTFVGDYVVKGTVVPDPHQCQPNEHWDEVQQKCVPDEQPPAHECPPNQHWDEATQSCVDNPPEPPVGDLLYDSHRDSKLHDGNVRTIPDKEGAITPNGLGIEMHASGNPRVVVNADGTFSLFGDAGFPRFYGYVVNYDATLEIECAFWNDVGQDLSLKTRSRHNEGGACENRFGGYGLAVDRNGYDAKREVCHNVHDQSQSGKLPTTPKTGEYFTIKWTVKDQGNEVRQIGEMNGQPFLNKIDSSPKPYMVDKASFEKQSYYWVRQNISKGTGEIRIKSLRILKA